MRHRYGVRHRRRYVRRQAEKKLYDQGNELAAKASADGISALMTRTLANSLCRSPYPDYALCQASNEVASKQADEFTKSLQTLAVWGGCVLVAALFKG